MQSEKKSFTDEELALKTQAGSRWCFEELVERYGPKLFQFLRRKIPSDQDREDIIQETFLKLYRSIERYDPHWKFSTWIFTAANRMAISHYRAHSRKIPHDLPVRSPMGPDEIHLIEAQKKNIWGAAQNLKAVYYEVLWLYYVEDMSTREIARVMQKTSAAIRLLLHRARIKLAKILEENALESGSQQILSESQQISLTENRG
jgi:RNA polymerase sigma-70 factor (ECF subfamily)